MRKNELIAITLSALVILIYFTVIYPKYAPPPKPPEGNQPSATVSVSTSTTAVTPETPTAVEKPAVPIAIDTALLAQAKPITFDKKFYTATFSTLGGKLTSWRLKQYKTVFESIESLEKELAAAQAKGNTDRVNLIQQRIQKVKQIDDLNLQLQKAESKKDAAEVNELKKEIETKTQVNLVDTFNINNLPLEVTIPGFDHLDNATLYQVTTTALSQNTTQLIFSAPLPNNITIQKIYQFNDRTYQITCQIKIVNISPKLIKFDENGAGFRIGLGSGLGELPIEARQVATYNLAPYAQLDKTIAQFKINQKNPIQTLSGDLVWAGMQTNYFLKALIPQVTVATKVTAEIGQEQLPNIWVQVPAFELPGKDTYSYPFSFYLGPKTLDSLEIAKLPVEQVLFPGYWLASLDLLVLKVLKFCYRLIPNYGIAIILLSIFFKLITLPLTQMSFKSMKKMQLLAPQMNEIKTKYKEDPRRMHQETMALMKKYKVSYGSGCLPMLIQMPIMFALYSTISRAVELRGQPFIWWVKDLSVPDTVSHIAGFPINILPVLMGITMVWQMHMTPNPDPQQKKTMMFMNIIFIFLFWSLSSGLVLYWFITNILSIIHQYYINKQPITLEPVTTTKPGLSRWQELKKRTR